MKTTGGQAETRRLWPSRRFWEGADAVLSACRGKAHCRLPSTRTLAAGMLTLLETPEEEAMMTFRHVSASAF